MNGRFRDLIEEISTSSLKRWGFVLQKVTPTKQIVSRRLRQRKNMFAKILSKTEFYFLAFS